MENFDAILDAWIADAQKNIDAHYARNLPNLTPTKLTKDEGGKRFVRIVKNDGEGTGRSVFCFVEKATGDVYKAASWKAPAKHARGYIFAPNPIAGVNEYGANYLV